MADAHGGGHGGHGGGGHHKSSHGAGHGGGGGVSGWSLAAALIVAGIFLVLFMSGALAPSVPYQL